jgi:predicted nucleic acid-binding protein
MTLLDTDVAIDIVRGHAPAVAWLQGLGSAPLGVPGLVVMELLQGCQNKQEQPPGFRLAPVVGTQPVIPSRLTRR